jgi:Alpha/beta hydrolase domain
MVHIRRILIAVLVALAGFARSASARVVRVEVLSRTDIAGGPFGAGGAYERIVGRVYFAFDPKNPHNAQIVDLSLAPRNAKGEVEAWSEFVILRPKDASKSAELAVVDVVNRGGMTTGVFNLGARRNASPDSAAFYGDALLLRRGLTVVMIGWQWDILPGGNALHFGAPPVGTATRPITGLVRSDITVDAATKTIPLGHRVGASQALGYPPADPNDPANTLSVRDDPLGPRTFISHSRWKFGRAVGDSAVPDSTSAYMASGFEPGKIYEVVYRAKNPVVVGAGLAAVRDIISYLKYDSTSIAPVKLGIAYGVSQTGRFLRHFIYQGFNQDERGRKAYDGFFAHTAGAGRGSFNHRFAQPSRDAQPYSTFFYPTDVFPFTSLAEIDPISHARGGLRAGSLRVQYDVDLPRVFYVDGGHEYWGRAASLTHTSVDGTRDVGFLPTERRYVISSAQHSSPGAFPPPDATLTTKPDVKPYRSDPLDQRLALRALLMDLVDWVKDGTEPPPSQYPTLATSTLVTPGRVKFPQIGTVPTARKPHQPYRYDFGTAFEKGIINLEPPRVGAPYTVLVSQVDSIGNDLGGIRSVEIQVPLATYFPWQLRTGSPSARDRLVSFQGTFVPLSRTEADRGPVYDSRPSIEKLYASRDAFLAKVDSATQSLVAARFMLPGDAGAARERMAATWDWIVR